MNENRNSNSHWMKTFLGPEYRLPCSKRRDSQIARKRVKHSSRHKLNQPTLSTFSNKEK